MKKVLLLWLAAGLLFSSFSSISSDNYEALPEESTITWAASRPGKTHDGTLAISSGSLVFEGNKLVSGDFKIDMTSIKVTDIKPGKMNERLVGHLKSADFFDVENHATGAFTISSTETKEGKTLVNGQLTLKGISNPVTFEADVTNDGNTVTLKTGEFKIDRTKWDIKYRSGKFFDDLKNKLIYDDIVVTVNVKATK